MQNIKNLFKENEWELITEILENGRKSENGTIVKWYTLARKYNIRTNAGTKKQKATAANDIWRKFLKIVNRNNLDLITVKQTLNGAGEVLFETKKRLPQEKEYSVDGMIIDKITTNPHGGEWITYKNQTKQNSESTLVLVQKLIDSHFINGNANRELKIDNIIFNTSSPEPSFFGVQDEVEYVNKKIAVVNLYDAHIDKLPVKSTCGVESTLEQNVEIFKETINRIIVELCVIKELKKIVLPIGNDLFHTNGFNSQTKKGTQIEYFGSPEDAYYVICDLITQVIKDLAIIAPVEVIMVKGNHDEDKITTLGYWLDRYFSYKNSKESTNFNKVNINFLRTQRKYVRFGENLIGFAHGDKEKSKISQLPLIMATEAKELWGQTTHRKMYLGDLHHGFEYQFLKAKDQPGVEVEYLRSVGTTDTWHEDFGWIGVPKTAYIQIFDEFEGEYNRIKLNIK
jgi:hypothetical protein